jgi:acyl CoA:acetate/3-ketoacid CoA transferase beta subunit
MRRKVKRAILYTTRHTPATFVPEVDSVTTSPRTGETAFVVTPMAVLSLGPDQALIESLLAGYTPEGVQKETGFELSWNTPLETLPPPTAEELSALNQLDPEGSRKRFQ